jgi:prevent-host-death family protein
MWSVVDAKAQLSEILRQARKGEPQFIGSQDPCVVVSLATYKTCIAEAEHDGLWLLDQAARLQCELPLPLRSEDRADVTLGE